MAEFFESDWFCLTHNYKWERANDEFTTPRHCPKSEAWLEEEEPERCEVMTIGDSMNFQPNEYDYTDYEVDPATVGQYIDLKDKNGVQIFRGDRVELIGLSATYVVEYKPDDAGYWPFVSNRISGLAGAEYKIIGNKWDNPEVGL